MSDLNQLIDAFPKHLWLEFSPQIQEKVRAQVRDYSNPVSCWNAYVNSLCLNAFVDWIQEEPDLRTDTLEIESDRQTLPSIWEFLNGSVIELDGTRLVLIPSETMDLDRFSVPFEWVDLPGFAANYYLAVQMNLEEDEGWMRIWGWTTYQRLKQGEKDEVRRTYILKRKELTESLNVMWVSREVCPEKKPVLDPLPALSIERVEQLLVQLSQLTPYSPRLEVAFEEWGALLANDRYRLELYRRRSQPENKASIFRSLSQIQARLGDWIQRNFAEAIAQGWSPELEPAFRFRSHRPSEHSKALLTNQLRSSQDAKTLIQTAKTLGKIDPRNSEAIEALVHLSATTEDETTRWNATLALGYLDPSHPQGAVCCSKSVDLGGQIVRLRTAVRHEVDGTVSILLEVRPAEGKISLPQALKLIVFDESGQPLLEKDKNDGEDYIQQQLDGNPGEKFSLQLVLGNRKVNEAFAI